MQHLTTGNLTNLNHEYCFERNKNESFLKICFGEEEDDSAYKPTESAPVEVIKAVYPICKMCQIVSLELFIHLFFLVMLSSVPFLMVTFLIYGCIKELRNLHGKCLMCYWSGLIVMFLSFSLIQLNHTKLQSYQSICTTAGYVAYISILTCFSWLNIMCYDINSTFRQVISL